MADTTLSPTGLVQIEVGASRDTWGAKLNTNEATVNGWFQDGGGGVPALKVANGGTGAVTADAARTNLGATSVGSSVFTAVDAAAARTALALGSAAVKNTGTSGDAVPLLNGTNTFSGAVTFTNPWENLALKAGAAHDGAIYARNSSGVLRWAFGIANDNAGGGWYLNRYNSSGVYVDTPILANLSTGAVTIGTGTITALSSGTATLTTANVTTLNVTGSCAGMTMTGTLIGVVGEALRLRADGASQGYANLYGSSGVLRWALGLDTDSNGTNFYLNRYNSSGVFQDRPLYVTSAGVVTITSASVGALTYSSDRRLKGDIADLEAGLTDGLRPRSFTYRGRHAWGFIAQEVQETAPHLVHEGDDGFLSMDGLQIIAALVKDLQDLRAEFDTYRAGHP